MGRGTETVSDEKRKEDGTGRWLNHPSLETTKMAPNPLAASPGEITRRIKFWHWRFNSRRKGHWLLALLLLLLLLGGVWWGGGAIFAPSQGKKIATLLQKRNAVDWRNAGAVEFKEADLNQPFVANDAVKTGSASEALLGFGASNELTVGENSLIIIRDADFGRGGEVAGLDLELSAGQLRGKAAGKLRIRTAEGGELEVVGSGGAKGEVWVERGGEGQPLAVSVFSGQGRIADRRGSLSLGPGKGARFGGEAAPQLFDLPPLPQVIYPQGAVTYDLLPGQQAAAQFQLQPENGVLYEIRIAKDEALNRLVVRKRQPFPRFSIPLAETGRYYWDVALVREGLVGPRSAVGTFEVVPKREGAPGAPAAGEAAAPGSAPRAAVETAPSLKVTGASGELLLARGAAKPRPVAPGSAFLEGDRLFVPVDGEGELSLRQAPLFRVLPFSEVELAQLEASEKVPAVKAKMRLKKGGMLFALKPLSGTGLNYELALGRHALQFGAPRAGKEAPAQMAVWSSASEPLAVAVFQGQVSLRLDNRTYSLGANQGLSLDRRHRLSLSPLPPNRIVIREREQPQVFFQSVSPRLTLSWTGKGGEVVLARDSNFSELLLQERVQENYFTLFGPRPGVYFWKVKPRGQELFRESNSFAVVRTPLLRERAKRTVRAEDSLTTVNYSYQTPVIQFSWGAKPEAKSYEIEIYAGKELTQKTYQKIFPGQQFSFLADFLSEGEFYWRVNAVAPSGTQYGTYARLVLTLDPDSPALEVMEPADNRVVSAAAVITRGQVLRQGRVEMNGAILGTSMIGPFEKKLTLVPGANDLVYKVLDRRDRLSYYYRLLVYE